MPLPPVSIVIVSWNGRGLLEQFLPSVLATDYPDFEVVVADNASTDGTAGWLADAHPAVRVVRHPENWLFARGNNVAVAQTDAPYVCLLNNDVETPAGWLSPLVAVLEDGGDVGAVQPKLLQHTDRVRFEYAGASGGFLDAVGYPFARGRVFSTLEDDEGQYDDARDVCWATGACLLIRRSAFEDAGGLDERFEMHMEEIDLCWRLWRAGWRIRVEPESTVYHLGGASLAQGNPRKTYLNFRNSLLMLYKNTPAAEWARVFRKRKLLDTLALARGLFAGGPAEASAIRRAYRDAHLLFEHYAEERPSGMAPSSMPRSMPPSMPQYEGSIAVDYFLRGRRHFSDLPKHRFHS